jgi:hypothetical protein
MSDTINLALTDDTELVLSDCSYVVENEQSYLSLFPAANAGDQEAKHIIACLHELGDQKREEGCDCVECEHHIEPQESFGAVVVIYHTEGISKSMTAVFCKACAAKYSGKQFVDAFHKAFPPDGVVGEAGHA